jgi:hypothetical protein
VTIGLASTPIIHVLGGLIEGVLDSTLVYAKLHKLPTSPWFTENTTKNLVQVSSDKRPYKSWTRGLLEDVQTPLCRVGLAKALLIHGLVVSYIWCVPRRFRYETSRYVTHLSFVNHIFWQADMCDKSPCYGHTVSKSRCVTSCLVQHYVTVMICDNYEV